jgi:hypothetical protein
MSTLSACFVSMRIVWYTIHTKIQQGLINCSLFDVKKTTDILDVEPLLVEQNQNLILEIL